MTSWKRKLAGALAGALTVAGLVTSSAGAATAHATHRAKQLTTLHLAYVPYSNDSSLFLAMEKGFFAREGLKVDISTAANPGVIIAGMESGEYQIGFSATVEAITATAHGTKLKCLSSVDGNQSPKTAQDGTMILATPKSGIKSVKDLVGKTVATVQTASLNSLTTDEMVYKAGGNPGKIHYVTMGFAEMPQALEQGSVQAAVVVAPFSQAAIQAGMRVIGHPNVEIMSNLSDTCFAATDGWLAHHIKLAHHFQKAMAQAIAYTPKHMKAAAATLVKNGLAKNLHEALAAKLGTDFNPKLKVASFVKLEHLLVRFDFLKSSEVPNAKSLVFPGT